MSVVKPSEVPKIDVVVIEGLALMKIIRHCHLESGGYHDEAQGVLLGLPLEQKLEVTNCFAYPRNPEGTDEERYQLDMMRLLRLVNVDYLSVGCYLSSSSSQQYVSRQLLESQRQYQQHFAGSFVLIYDPLKTAAGLLSVRALRLSGRAVELVQQAGYFDYELLNKLRLTHHDLFHELKVVVRNSHLVNALLSELSELFPENVNVEQMDLASAPGLVRHMRGLMECSDELSQVHQYQKMVAKQQIDKQRYLQRRAQENAQRKLRGEPLLPEESDDPSMRQLLPPRDGEAPVVLTAQMAVFCRQINSLSSQTLAKLFLAESVRQQAQ